MVKESAVYKACVEILKEELVPAMGCTEPIALAYAAAKARDILGKLPEKVILKVSGSIIKNVKSVVVPNTGGMKGLAAATAAGIVAGVSEKELEVLSSVSDAQKAEINAYLDAVPIEIEHIEDGHIFDIVVYLAAGGDWVTLRISDNHTNITFIEKNGQVLLETEASSENEGVGDRNLLSIEAIWDFAQTVDLADVTDLLERQIAYNTAIAEEGLRGTYGANIGKTILATHGDSDVLIRAKAKAAAGSDARMSGCELPVVINSGSGNQGITCTVPVVEYARSMSGCAASVSACAVGTRVAAEAGKGINAGKGAVTGYGGAPIGCGGVPLVEKNSAEAWTKVSLECIPREKLLRALIISNLTSIHVKTGIGTLSAFCGAVSAAIGAAAGISYLRQGTYFDYLHTVSNALGIAPGIVCDGAKASCAAKIASALDAAFLAYHMYQNGQEFQRGDGLIASDIEKTIANIGRLGRVGMKQTNDEIIQMMINANR